MEMYYGEPTIKELIIHSRQITEHIKEFSDIYNLVEERSDNVQEIDLE